MHSRSSCNTALPAQQHVQDCSLSLLRLCSMQLPSLILRFLTGMNGVDSLLFGQIYDACTTVRRLGLLL